MTDPSLLLELIRNAIATNLASRTIDLILQFCTQFCTEEYPKRVKQREVIRSSRIEIEQIIENPKLLKELSDSKSLREMLPDSVILKPIEILKNELSAIEQFKICEFFSIQGLYQYAKLFYERFQDRFESLNQEQPHNMIVWWGAKGSVYSSLAEHKIAIQLHRKSLETAEKTPEDKMKTPKRVTLGNCHNNLAEAFWKKGDLRQAKREYKLAIEQVNDNDDEKLYYLINSVKAYSTPKDSTIAKNKLEEVSRILEEDCRSISVEHSEQKKNLVSLYYNAAAQMYDNDPEKQELAREFYKKAIDTIKKNHNFPGKLHNLAICLHNLGLHYCRREMYEDSEKCFNNALDLRKKLFSNTHPDIAQSVGALGTMHSKKGNKDEAKKYLEVAWRLSKMSLGKNHPQVVSYSKQLKSI